MNPKEASNAESNDGEEENEKVLQEVGDNTDETCANKENALRKINERAMAMIQESMKDAPMQMHKYYPVEEALANGVPEMLFFETVKPWKIDPIYTTNLCPPSVSEIDFKVPVFLTEIRVIPLGLAVHTNFSDSVRLGETSPSDALINFRVKNLNRPYAGTYLNIGYIQCHPNENDTPYHFHIDRENIVPTQSLALCGKYESLSIMVVGIPWEPDKEFEICAEGGRSKCGKGGKFLEREQEKLLALRRKNLAMKEAVLTNFRKRKIEFGSVDVNAKSKIYKNVDQKAITEEWVQEHAGLYQNVSDFGPSNLEYNSSDEESRKRDIIAAMNELVSKCRDWDAAKALRDAPPSQRIDRALPINVMEPISEDGVAADNINNQSAEFNWNVVQNSDVEDNRNARTHFQFVYEMLPFLKPTHVTMYEWYQLKPFPHCAETKDALKALIEIPFEENPKQWVERAENLLKSGGLKEKFMHFTEKDLVTLFRPWIMAGMGNENARKHSDPTYVPRHIKCFLTMVQELFECGEGVCVKLVKGDCKIQWNLLKQMCEAYTSHVFIKFILKLLSISLNYGQCAEVFVDREMSGYKWMLEFLLRNAPALSFTTMREILLKIHYYELLDVLKKAVQNRKNKLEVRRKAMKKQKRLAEKRQREAEEKMRRDTVEKMKNLLKCYGEKGRNFREEGRKDEKDGSNVKMRVDDDSGRTNDEGKHVVKSGGKAGDLKRMEIDEKIRDEMIMREDAKNMRLEAALEKKEKQNLTEITEISLMLDALLHDFKFMPVYYFRFFDTMVTLVDLIREKDCTILSDKAKECFQAMTMMEEFVFLCTIQGRRYLPKRGKVLLEAMTLANELEKGEEDTLKVLCDFRAFIKENPHCWGRTVMKAILTAHGKADDLEKMLTTACLLEAAKWVEHADDLKLLNGVEGLEVWVKGLEDVETDVKGLVEGKEDPLPVLKRLWLYEAKAEDLFVADALPALCNVLDRLYERRWKPNKELELTAVVTTRLISRILKIATESAAFSDTSVVRPLLKAYIILEEENWKGEARNALMELMKAGMGRGSSVGESCWCGALREIFTFTMECPERWRNGLKLLGELLPNTLPMVGTSKESDKEAVMAARLLWAAHFMPLEEELRNFLTVLCKVRAYHASLVTFCIRLGDLSSPTSGMVVKAVLTAVSTRGNKDGKVGPDVLSVLADILAEPSLKAAALANIETTVAVVVNALRMGDANEVQVAAICCGRLCDSHISLMVVQDDLTLAAALPDAASMTSICRALLRKLQRARGFAAKAIFNALDIVARTDFGYFHLMETLKDFPDAFYNYAFVLVKDELYEDAKALVDFVDRCDLEDLLLVIKFSMDEGMDEVAGGMDEEDELPMLTLMWEVGSGIEFMNRVAESVWAERGERTRVVLPQPESLSQQFVKREVFCKEERTEKRQHLDLSHISLPMMNLLDISRKFPENFSLKKEVRKLLNDEKREGKSRTLKKGEKEAEMEKRFTPRWRIKGNAYTGRYWSREGSDFRNGMQNSSPAPSIHVDEFEMRASGGMDRQYRPKQRLMPPLINNADIMQPPLEFEYGKCPPIRRTPGEFPLLPPPPHSQLHGGQNVEVLDALCASRGYPHLGRPASPLLLTQSRDFT